MREWLVWLNGKKTYIAGLAGLVFAGTLYLAGHEQGAWDVATFAVGLLGVRGGLSLASVMQALRDGWSPPDEPEIEEKAGK